MIRLDNRVLFYSRTERMKPYIDAIHEEIKEGNISSDVHVFAMALNTQAWALMQIPVRGEA